MLGKSKAFIYEQINVSLLFPLISSPPHFMLKPLNVLSAPPLPTTVTPYFHCSLLPHRSVFTHKHHSSSAYKWFQLHFLMCITRTNCHLHNTRIVAAEYYTTTKIVRSTAGPFGRCLQIGLDFSHMLKLQKDYKAINQTELLVVIKIFRCPICGCLLHCVARLQALIHKVREKLSEYWAYECLHSRSHTQSSTVLSWSNPQQTHSDHTAIHPPDKVAENWVWQPVQRKKHAISQTVSNKHA